MSKKKPTKILRPPSARRKKTWTPQQAARRDAYLQEQEIVPAHGVGRLRPFKAGNPGRPLGAKDTIRRGQKASIRALLAEFVLRNPNKLRKLIKRGLLNHDTERAFPFFKLATYMLDGAPVAQHKITGSVAKAPVFDLSQLSTEELRAFRTLLQKVSKPGDEEDMPT